MKTNLSDKVVVVTGGASGIGLGIAQAFLDEDCRVAICDINEQTLGEVSKQFQAAGVSFFCKKVDVSKHEEVLSFADDVVTHFGRIDVWINNAGIFSSKALLEETIDSWNRVIQVNLNSCFSGTQAAAKYMKESGGGVIINTSSYSSIIPAGKRSAYVASKYAINGFTRISAGELAPYNIRVNAVAPGSIETPMQKKIGRTPEEKEKLVSKIALRRTCQPEELASVYLFLASDAASYITADVIEVSGGKISLQDNGAAWDWAKT